MDTQTHISSSYLIKSGWTKKPTQRIDGNHITMYEKKENTITYNGIDWLLNNKKVIYNQELP